jgi:molecular chaperone Hsp33
MIKKKIYGNTLKEQLIASSKDRLHNFLLAEGMVRGVIVNGTRMVNEMRANHELGVLETLVLGHAYLGGALMSANVKGHDRISFRIDCSGPIKGFVVEANAYNEVRGYLKNTVIKIERPLEDFNLAPFFGAGFLTVTKYIQDRKQPFTGKVALEYGNIAQDLANYFLTSEQVPTAFNLSVQFDSGGEVAGAGGLFLQVMPDADEQTISGLEKLVSNFPSMGAAYVSGIDPESLVARSFRKYSPKFLASSRVEFLCHCKKERMQSFISALPKEEKKDILEKGPFPLEIRCHNCNTVYHFSKKEIHQIYNEKSS